MKFRLLVFGFVGLNIVGCQSSQNDISKEISESTVNAPATQSSSKIGGGKSNPASGYKTGAPGAGDSLK